MARIEHIGIAIPNDPDVVRLFTDLLGAPVYKSEHVPSEGVSTHFIDAGGARIELLESSSDHSPVKRFLEKRGPGVHHLAFEVDDLEATFARMQRAGVELASTEIKDGADGKRVFFLHPRGTSGVLIEFCQSSRSVLQPLGPGLARAGRAGAPRIVIVTRDITGGEVDLLSRHFERSCDVTAVAAGTAEEPWSDSVVTADLAIFSDPAIANSAVFTPTSLPRAVVFVGPNDTDDNMWSQLTPDILSGVLAIGPASMAAEFSRPPITATGRRALLPIEGSPFSVTGLSLSLAMITSHLLAKS